MTETSSINPATAKAGAVNSMIAGLSGAPMALALFAINVIFLASFIYTIHTMMAASQTESQRRDSMLEKCVGGAAAIAGIGTGAIGGNKP